MSWKNVVGVWSLFLYLWISLGALYTTVSIGGLFSLMVPFVLILLSMLGGIFFLVWKDI